MAKNLIAPAKRLVNRGPSGKRAAWELWPPFTVNLFGKHGGVSHFSSTPAGEPLQKQGYRKNSLATAKRLVLDPGPSGKDAAWRNMAVMSTPGGTPQENPQYPQPMALCLETCSVENYKLGQAPLQARRAAFPWYTAFLGNTQRDPPPKSASAGKLASPLCVQPATAISTFLGSTRRGELQAGTNSLANTLQDSQACHNRQLLFWEARRVENFKLRQAPLQACCTRARFASNRQRFLSKRTTWKTSGWDKLPPALAHSKAMFS